MGWNLPNTGDESAFPVTFSPRKYANVQLQQACMAGELPGPVLFHRTARTVNTQTPS